MHIHTGLYSHPASSYSVAWIGRAIRKQTDWCRKYGLFYEFNASPLQSWERFAKFPSSWAFGTLLKFDSLRKFLDSPRQGDRFVWIDLDVYPTDAATSTDLVEAGPTAFFAPNSSPDYCGFPGLANMEHFHMYCKLFWSECEFKTQYRALSSGMFMMSRSVAEGFWAWLERDHPVDSPQWWEAYHAEQLRCIDRMAQLGNRGVEPYHLGSEEMILEKWLNNEPVEFKEIDCNFTHLVDGIPSKFVHYYGGTKDRYPES